MSIQKSGVFSDVKIFACLYTHQKLKKKKSWSDGELRISVSQNKCSLYDKNSTKAGGNELKDSKYLLKWEIDKILNHEANEVEFEGFLVTVEHEINTSIHNKSTEITSVSNGENSSSISGTKRNILPATRGITHGKFKIPRTVIPEKPVVDATEREISYGRNDNNNKSSFVHGAIDRQVGKYPSASLSRDTHSSSMSTVNKSGSIHSANNGSSGFGAYVITDEELDDIWNIANNGTMNEDGDISTNVYEANFNSHSPPVASSSGRSIGTRPHSINAYSNEILSNKSSNNNISSMNVLDVCKSSVCIDEVEVDDRNIWGDTLWQPSTSTSSNILAKDDVKDINNSQQTNSNRRYNNIFMNS
jgi:hypothetical protein